MWRFLFIKTIATIKLLMKFRNFFLKGLVILTLTTPTFMMSSARAACEDPSGGINSGINCQTSPLTVPEAMARVVNLLLYIVGIASVIVMVVGGLRYVLSTGDPKNTTAAKDTILYAAIGLVVALLAYAIVNFVLVQFKA